MTDEEIRQRFLEWRDIEDPCLTCDGSGRRAYGSTATWRGGIGGQTITGDTCDVCWGSGDRYRHGVNLRLLRSQESKRVAEQAVDLLARSVGSQLSGCKPDILHLILEFDKIMDRRNIPLNVFRRSLLLSLRNVLARAITMDERKE